jgi:hypothetical protein
MSDLEQQMKSVAKDMIVDASPALLVPADISTIAAFAFKTAIIYDHLNMGEGRRPLKGTFFSPKTRQDFRCHLKIPDGVHIWLAKFVSRAARAGRLRGGYFNFKRGPRKDFRFFVVTYATGHFAFQILCSRWRGRHKAKVSPPRVIQHPRWSRASVLMWPNEGQPVGWPPPQHFTDGSIDAFADRWEVI